MASHAWRSSRSHFRVAQGGRRPAAPATDPRRGARCSIQRSALGHPASRHDTSAAALAALVALADRRPGVAGAADFTPRRRPSRRRSPRRRAATRVHLASGSYGCGAAVSKLRWSRWRQSGATPTMSGGNFGSSVRNITIRWRDVHRGGGGHRRGRLAVEPGLRGDTWGNVGALRVTRGALSIVRRRGRARSAGNGSPGHELEPFGSGGCSDGIQDSSNGTEIGPKTSSTASAGLLPRARRCDPALRVDDIYIHGNYFHDN